MNATGRRAIKTLQAMSEGRFAAVNELKFLSSHPVGLRLEWTIWTEPGPAFKLRDTSCRIAEIMKAVLQDDVAQRRGLKIVTSPEFWAPAAAHLEGYCRRMGASFRRVTSGERLTPREIVQLALCESYGYLIFSGEEGLSGLWFRS